MAGRRLVAVGQRGEDAGHDGVIAHSYSLRTGTYDTPGYVGAAQGNNICLPTGSFRSEEMATIDAVRRNEIFRKALLRAGFPSFSTFRVLSSRD